MTHVLRDLNDPPPRERSRRLGVVALVLALAAGLLAAGTARADEPARFAPAVRSPRDAVVDLAERHFPPAWVGWAVRTARCESGYDLGAYSAGFDRRFGWYEHVGPWQIAGRVWRARAWEMFGGPLEDPEVNAAMAAWIAVNLGPGHWPVCGVGGGV